MSWIAQADADESCSRLLAQPRFDRAARTLAANMLDAAAQNDALDGIFKDAGRYVAALWAMYAHVTGGLTLPRLKEICASSGLLSPGRARALLLYLRYLGYIESAGRDQNRLAHYAPTKEFIQTWRKQLRAALEAARVIEPAVDIVLDRLEDPHVLETFARIQGEQLLSSAQNSEIMKSPFMRIFVSRHAGSQVIFQLVAGDDNTFPSRAPLPFSTAAAAKRFRVSRVHIKRMLDDAEREGLVMRRADGTIILTDGARATIREFYAMQLIQLLSQTARTIRERPEFFGRKSAQTSAAPEPMAAAV